MRLHGILAMTAAVALAAPVAADPPTGDSVPPVVVRIIPATPVVAAEAPQPLICRSSVETGSLIQRHKQCLTKAQWRYVDDQHQGAARKLVEDQMTKPFCDAHC